MRKDCQGFCITAWEFFAKRAAALLLVVAASFACTNAANAQSFTFISNGITGNSAPSGIGIDANGGVWFTEQNNNKIGRISGSNVVSEYGGMTAGANPVRIAAGVDGNMWFTEYTANKIGRITPAGVITEFSIPTSHAGTYGIALGPDNNLWFCEGAGKIGQITPQGQITEFSAGITSGANPFDITAGPDGAMWFTEAGSGRIGRITTAGVVTEFGGSLSGPTGITAGPDGNLWFTENPGNKIGRITPAGTITEFSAGISANANLQAIAKAADGALWFVESATGNLGRITTAGVVSETAVPNVLASNLDWMVEALDGSLWFTALKSSTVVNFIPAAASSVTYPLPTLSGGRFHSLAINADGSVRAWGDDTFGELGDGGSVTSTAPIQIAGLTGMVQVSASNQFSVALKSDGTVWAWGNNGNGQLGDGTQTLRSTPVTLNGISGVTAVSAGFLHTVALKSDGTVWAWGSNASGQLGNGTLVSSLVPVQVTGLSGTVQAIAPGQTHTLVLKTDGTVWAWGDNSSGQLGVGSTTNHTTPVQVTGLTNVIAISAKASHSVALTADGSVWCWGDNTNGQDGDGTTTNRTSPFKVPGVTATAISAGSQFTLALTSGGTLSAWGQNSSGQLGDGTTTQRLTPVTVTLPATPTMIAAGATHSLALKADGTVMAWGSNSSGQLGDGTLAARSAAVATVHENGSGSLAGASWFLDLVSTSGVTLASSLTPPFLVATTGAIGTGAATVSSTIEFNPADAAKSGTLYVTAFAAPGALPGTNSANGSTPQLYSLTANGTWLAVSGQQLTAYATAGNASLSNNAISVLNAASVTALAGAQFCLGYSSGVSTTIASRIIATIPASTTSASGSCVVTSLASVTPQAGYWWNPAEGGRGFTIEQNAATGNVFVATYLYAANGEALWYAAGPTPMSGATFSAPLNAYQNGQTLGGAFVAAGQGTSPGNIAITFSDTSHATLTWPGGTIPIQRYEYVTGGLNSPPTATQPQSGYWWNPAEGGRGYTVEVQGGITFIAAYMYDTSGNPVWYASGPLALSGTTYSGQLSAYSGGQTLTGTFHAATGIAPVGNITIQFTSATTGVLTLPNGTQVPIQRYAF